MVVGLPRDVAMVAGKEEMGLLLRIVCVGSCCSDGSAGIKTCALVGSGCSLATKAAPAKVAA